VTHDVDAPISVSCEHRHRVNPVIGVYRGGVELHRIEDSRRIRRHRVWHVSPLAVKKYRYVRRYRFPDGQQPFPSVRTILFPKCCIWFVTARNIGRGVNEPSTEIDRFPKAARDQILIGIQTNAQERVSGDGRCSKSVEVCHSLAITSELVGRC